MSQKRAVIYQRVSTGAGGIMSSSKHRNAPGDASTSRRLTQEILAPMPLYPKPFRHCARCDQTQDRMNFIKPDGVHYYRRCLSCRTPPSSPNPSGLCMCGCGQKTNPSTRNRPHLGRIKGQPVAYIRGHSAVANRKKTRYIIEDLGYQSPCWTWLLAKSEDDYGMVRVNGTLQKAHRHYWEQRNGPIPDGLEIDHLCRNPSCVNPDHLEPVTRTEHQIRERQRRVEEAQKA